MDNVSIAIIICTYKREQYVLRNIGVLKKYCKDVIKHVYVIDNGQTLNTKLSDDFIHIVPNKNLGGSGGFARGMYEAKKNSNCSHIFLMDDDIEFTPEVIHKAYDRLCGFTEEEKDDWIGFGMVTFDKPNIIHECGAYWNGIKLRANNKGLKLNSKKDLNHKLKYNYSAWWSLIMPISVIDKYGYPMPFFIKFDDIEYALRCKRTKIHFYKDLYVKHESMKNKYNPKIEYYSMRNALITNAVHSKHPLMCSLSRYILRVGKTLLHFNLKGVFYINIGLNAFLNKFKPISADDVNNEIKDYKFSISLICLLFIPIIVVKNIIFLIIKFITDSKFIDYQIVISEKFWINKFK